MDAFKCVTVCALLSLLANSVCIATPPRPPVTVRLDQRALEAATAGGKSVVTLPIQIQANQPVIQVSLKVSVRRVDTDTPRAERENPNVLFEQTLAPRKLQEQRVSVPLKGLPPGEYDLDLFISGQLDESNGFSDRDLWHLTVTQDGTNRLESVQSYQRHLEEQRQRKFRSDLEQHPRSPKIKLLMHEGIRLPAGLATEIGSLDVPPERQLLVKPSSLPESLAHYYVEHEKQSWTSNDPLTLKGRVVFQDVDGGWKPLVNASINIWDDDTFGDEHLGTLVSDWDGRWTFSVNNDDGWLQDGRDVYFTYELANTRLNLTQCSGDYRWHSDTHDDSADGSVIDFGDWTVGSGEMNSLIVWNALNRAWNHVTTVGGQDPGLIKACFPASATATGGTTLGVAAGDFDGDGITHEYGHALMAAANGSDPSPGGAHGFGDCSQAQSLSWSEGWATGFMLSVLPDNKYNWHFGDTGQELEAFSSKACHTGETSEAWVSAALLDMTDAHDDGNGGDANLGRNGYSDHNAQQRIGLASMYRDTLWGNAPNNDVLQFWYSLAGEIPQDQKNPGQEIMYYNYMSVLPPDSCVATKVATASLDRPDPVLSGVRRFRDLALKPLPDGRELINSYYRNSPEMALLLVKHPTYIPDALRVLQHFGMLGDLIGNNAHFRQAVEANVEVIPAEVRTSVGKLMELFTRNGGRTLRADTHNASTVFERVKALHLVEFLDTVGTLKAQTADKPFIRLAPHAFAPESRKALQDPAIRAVRAKGLPPAPGETGR
ncbi:MAG: hypothetical protein ACJ8R9_25970 [Steroidobacteraceae bacterium]